MRSTTKGLIITIALLSAIVLGPSSLLSQWFPLDLGGTFEIGDLFDEKKSWIVSPYNGSGRYFPVYWLFSSFQYLFFKTHVIPYFLVQSAIFIWAISLTCLVLEKLIGASRYLWFLAILLFLNTPIAENSATLGKAEPAAYLLLIAALYIFLKYKTARSALGMRRYLWIGLLFALALLTKETSLALVGFALSGFVLTVLTNRGLRIATETTPKDYLKLLLTLVAAWSITKIPYLIFWDPSDLPTYLDYRVTTELVRSNLTFYATQQPDVLVFLFLGGLLLLSRIVHLVKAPTPEKSSGLIVVISMYAMGLAYYVILLAWRWPMAYYMLLPSVLFRLATVYGLYHLVRHTSGQKLIGISAFALSFAALLYSGAYLFYVIGSQISYSRLYTQAIRTYAQESKGETRLVMENYPFYAEQVTGTHLIMRFAFGKWFRIGGISDLFESTSNSSEVQRLLGISDERMKANMQNLPRGGDYLLVFTGKKVATWFLRGVTPFIHGDSVFKNLGNYDLEPVATNSIKIPALYFNIWTGDLEAKQTSLGFSLYKVKNAEARYFWQDRAPDRWLGKQSTLYVNETFGPKPRLKISSPPFALPNRVKILKDGRLFREISISDTNEVFINLDEQSKGTSEYQILVEKTVAPADIGLNLDTRKLGVLADLEHGTR